MKNWREIGGWFDEEEGEYAQTFCQGKKVLEIGAFHGRSTCALSDVAEEVHTIDNFTLDLGGGSQDAGPQGYPTFLENIAGRTNITCYVGNAADILPTIPDNYFDVVLVDGLHVDPHVENDIRGCLPKLKEDGIFLIHDYNVHGVGFADVKRTTDRLFDIPSPMMRCMQLVALPKSLFRG
jgi:predicted O-methyltransferase YrrM